MSNDKLPSLTLDAHPRNKPETVSIVLSEPLLSRVQWLQKITGERKSDVIRELMEISTGSDSRTLLDLVATQEQLEGKMLEAAQRQAAREVDGIEGLSSGASVERITFQRDQFRYTLKKNHLHLEGLVRLAARLGEGSETHEASYVFEGGILPERQLEFRVGGMQVDSAMLMVQFDKECSIADMSSPNLVKLDAGVDWVPDGGSQHPYILGTVVATHPSFSRLLASRVLVSGFVEDISKLCARTVDLTAFILGEIEMEGDPPILHLRRVRVHRDASQLEARVLQGRLMLVNLARLQARGSRSESEYNEAQKRAALAIARHLGAAQVKDAIESGSRIRTKEQYQEPEWHPFLDLPEQDQDQYGD